MNINSIKIKCNKNLKGLTSLMLKLNVYITLSIIVLISIVIYLLYPSSIDNPVYKIASNNTYECFIPEKYVYQQPPYDILIVSTNCFKNKDFNIKNSKFPIIMLHCSRETNWKDSREGGLMLLFIHRQKLHHLAKKYIFIHDHNTSWHYNTNIWDRINYIVNTDYFKEREYGALYCEYYYFGKGTHADVTAHNIQKVYDEIDYLHLNISKPNELIKEKYIIPCCSSFFIDANVYDRFDNNYFINLFISLRNHTIKYYNRYKNEYHKKVIHINWLNGVFLEIFWSIFLGYKVLPFPPNCTNHL